MAELVDAVTSWPTLLSVLLVFGFAPGFVLRLLVMIYPKDDPRRRELVAELYAIRRLERPLFVAEQLETVLFEGVPHRARGIGSRMLRTSRILGKFISELSWTLLTVAVGFAAFPRVAFLAFGLLIAMAIVVLPFMTGARRVRNTEFQSSSVLHEQFGEGE